jgi:hypothetical protein
LLPDSRFDERPPKAEKLHRKRMATVAAVYTVEPFVRTPQEFLHSLMPAQPGAKPTTVRPRPVAKRVWASVEKETWQVILEALEEAGKRDPQRVRDWVVAVDGAEDQLDRLLEMAEAYDVKITLIVDIIHVTQYIWKAARAFFPNDRIELEYAAWANVKSVLEGKAIGVARTLRRKATVDRLSADRRKPVDKCADYLLKYADHLQYDRYLAAGYPIATGVIEGACRYLVGDRMELTGARWRLKGAEAVLKLRALRASGDFDAYWTFHEAREYQRNHAQHYAGGSPPPMLEPATPQPRPRLRRVK